MDRLSCGTCKHFKNVGYQHWGECTAQVPRWAWGEYIETTRQVFRDGSTADFAPDCEAYTPNAEAHGQRSRTVQPLVGNSESQGEQDGR